MSPRKKKAAPPPLAPWPGRVPAEVIKPPVVVFEVRLHVTTTRGTVWIQRDGKEDSGATAIAAAAQAVLERSHTFEMIDQRRDGAKTPRLVSRRRDGFGMPAMRLWFAARVTSVATIREDAEALAAVLRGFGRRVRVVFLGSEFDSHTGAPDGAAKGCAA